jgi:Arc/MetJ family transcription regulator
LLSQLSAGGTTLHVRADDDVSGQEIVAGLRASIPNARYGAIRSAPQILRATRSRTLMYSCTIWIAAGLRGDGDGGFPGRGGEQARLTYRDDVHYIALLDIQLDQVTGIIIWEDLMSRTVVDLDDEALSLASEELGTKSKVATVNAALRRVANQRAAAHMLELLDETGADLSDEALRGAWRDGGRG